MRIDVKECARLLLEQDDILILTHAHPDGDTLGCGFALCRALLQKGKFACEERGRHSPQVQLSL